MLRHTSLCVHKLLAPFFAILLTLLISACSGGGSSSIYTTTFDMSVSSGGVKSLTFSWNAYSGASYYKLLVNPDGSSGYTQQGTAIVGTTTDIVIPVHLTDWVNASYLIEAYDNGDRLLATSKATSVSELMLSTIGYFKASNTGAEDWFGLSLALSGDGTTLAVGAPFEDSGTTGINSTPDNSAANSGAVYLFRHVGNSWIQQAYIKASNTGAGDEFGYSVALSSDGNTLAVGAHAEDSGTTGINSTPDESVNASGAAYLFRYDGSNWVQEAYIKAGNAGSAAFGHALSLSNDGNTLAVGAYAEDSGSTGINSTPDASASGSGAAYIFRYAGGSWAQQAYIKASNTGIQDGFGYSIALSNDGNTLAVGAPDEDSGTGGINTTPDNNAADSGAVYLFRYDGSNWAQQAYIKAFNTGAGDAFGFSLALNANGNTLAVGAPNEESSTTGINSTPDDSIPYSGAAYLFRYNGSSWVQQAYIKASNTQIQDFFGASIALSGDGNILVVGAFGEGSTTTGINSTPEYGGGWRGAAYLLRYSGSSWTQRAYIKSSNSGPDRFGDAVDLSIDGNTLAVGAPAEDSSTTGINSTPDDSSVTSGAVYLY